MNCYFILWQETVSKIYFSTLLEDRHTQTASCQTRENEVLVIDVVFSITNHVKLHHACCFQWRPIFYVWQPFYNFRLPKGDFEKHCTCSTEMAGKEEQSCSSCFKNTKYNCLWCQEYYCMPCSVFEDDETVKGWSGQFSRLLLWAMFLRSYPWESRKRLNVMIQMKLAKIEIYRPFSFFIHEIKVGIDTRYADWISRHAIVAPKSDLIQLGSAHEWSSIWTGPKQHMFNLTCYWFF